MNHWNFILGSYGVTLIVFVVEILAVRARRRAAARTAAASAPPAAARPATSSGAAR
jgi:heme exporter protein CcmD